MRTGVVEPGPLAGQLRHEPEEGVEDDVVLGRRLTLSVRHLTVGEAVAKRGGAAVAVLGPGVVDDPPRDASEPGEVGGASGPAGQVGERETDPRHGTGLGSDGVVAERRHEVQRPVRSDESLHRVAPAQATVVLRVVLLGVEQRVPDRTGPWPVPSLEQGDAGDGVVVDETGVADATGTEALDQAGTRRGVRVSRALQENERIEGRPCRPRGGARER